MNQLVTWIGIGAYFVICIAACLYRAYIVKKEEQGESSDEDLKSYQSSKKKMYDIEVDPATPSPSIK